MTKLVNYKNDTFLSDGSRVLSELRVPSFDDTISSVREEHLDEMVKLLITRHVSKVKEFIERYKGSELPNKFIYRQKYYVTKLEPLGAYVPDNDWVCIDGDALNGLGNVSSHILGHEIGHKILNYIDADVALKELANILDISLSNYRPIIQEFFAEAAGDMVHPGSARPFYKEVVGIKKEIVKNLVLKNIYHC